MQGRDGLWGQEYALCTPVSPTLSRISSVSKIFPVLMLYRLWEEGTVASLDDPLEHYASSFTINNPLGMASAPTQQSLMDGLDEAGPAPRPSPVTLRRMASQLSGEWFCTYFIWPQIIQVGGTLERTLTLCCSLNWPKSPHSHSSPAIPAGSCYSSNFPRPSCLRDFAHAVPSA